MHVTVNRKNVGVLVSCSGTLTGELLLRLKREVARNDYRGMRFLLVDLSQVEAYRIAPSEIQLSVQEDHCIAAVAGPGLIVAVVAPQDLGYGLARMWEVFTEQVGARTHVFRSTNEAEAWIERTLAAVYVRS